ncbi:Mbov_0396 family ICE element transmembrane protein [Butyrivibrio sp. WCD3002]|uniref:Mbov_0396 family ICE element transmembrane protein n=1 Tax=Butyrivibrio sp. WCD3002 TaxID=1280676 RepID=UPI0004050431|nr:hypothetical protein [Butyrivibrio sp. WCD3002]
MNTPVQLGWIQSAINYVFDKVLNPIFSWISGLLSDSLKWLFNSVLGDLLQSFLETCVHLAARLFWRIFGRIFYRIECGLLSIVDMMQNIFNVLAGTAPVEDTQEGIRGSLLSVIARKPFIVQTMLLIIAVAFVLVFVFAIIGTLKSVADMGAPGSKSVGHVLRQTGQALLRMIMAPVLGLFLIVLADSVMMSITNAMTVDQHVTIARTLFVISSLDAVDDTFGSEDQDGKKYTGSAVEGYNYSTRPEYLASHPGAASDYGLMDKFRRPFYNGTRDYSKAADVDDVFDMTRLDFMIGIGGAILFMFILGTALFVFVSRLFDVLVLLLIEPFFIATMPLDDGEHFKKWEDLFIGKLFSGYGMVVAMYLYLLISSMVFAGDISFTPRNGIGDIMMDMLMKLILLVGGAATVMTAGPLVTSVLSSAAAMQEGGAAGAGMAFTGKLMDLASKPIQYGLGAAGGKVAEVAVEEIGKIARGDVRFRSLKPEAPSTGGGDGKNDNPGVPSNGINPETSYGSFDFKGTRNRQEVMDINAKPAGKGVEIEMQDFSAGEGTKMQEMQEMVEMQDLSDGNDTGSNAFRGRYDINAQKSSGKQEIEMQDLSVKNSNDMKNLLDGDDELNFLSGSGSINDDDDDDDIL